MSDVYVCYGDAESPQPTVVNLNNVPHETLKLFEEMAALTLGGHICGAAIVATRRHGLPPMIVITDAVVDRPEIALGLLMARLTYLLNQKL